MTTRKKLIEVALPLEAINEASAREKSIRHGHPSTLHLWWARRPLAACRAVIFASLVDDPDDPAAQARLGELYASDGRFDSAIECFERVTALAPGSPQGWFTLARYYEAEERDDDARRAYDRALALDPTNTSAHNNREKLLIKHALELG